ncbi:MAG: hypothetical protein PHH82_04595 [Candidatus ainarchaeum sp.]|nr:hypothetical protein [Candidatus ainarchaeum sp.]
MFTTTIFATGVIADATGTPSAIVYKNGVATADVVTVAKVGTGLYKYSVTPSGFSAANIITIIINAVVSGVTQNSIVFEAICADASSSIPAITTMYGMFVVHRFDTGSISDADSLPSTTLYKNGTATAITVTVAKVDTGIYKYSSLLTGFTDGDEGSYVITATVNSISAGISVNFNYKQETVLVGSGEVYLSDKTTTSFTFTVRDVPSGAVSMKMAYRTYKRSDINDWSFTASITNPVETDTINITGLTEGVLYEVSPVFYSASGIGGNFGNILKLQTLYSEE